MNNFRIIPYVEQNGAWTLPDETMIGVWNRLVFCDLVDTLFYSGETTTPESFLRLVKAPHNVVNVVVDERQIVFISWLNDVGPNFAFGHFCGFPEIWGKHSVEVGKMVVDYWFDNFKLLDTIIGKIPAVNKMAVRFIEKLGFTILGTIPHLAHGHDENKKVGDVLTYITREQNNG